VRLDPYNYSLESRTMDEYGNDDDTDIGNGPIQRHIEASQRRNTKPWR
jgi:hypothetical protein